MTTPILSARDIVKTFGEGHTLVRAVDGVSVQLQPGEMVTITGPSGSGKTTLVSILGALLRPTSGEVRIDGAELSAMDEAELSRLRARSIGFVFQSFNLLEALSVRDNVLFPAHLAPGGTQAAEARADDLLAKLGLTERRNAERPIVSGSLGWGHLVWNATSQQTCPRRSLSGMSCFSALRLCCRFWRCMSCAHRASPRLWRTVARHCCAF